MYLISIGLWQCLYRAKKKGCLHVGGGLQTGKSPQSEQRGLNRAFSPLRSCSLRCRRRRPHTGVLNGQNPPIKYHFMWFHKFFLQIFPHFPAYSHSFRFRSLYALDIQNLSNRCSNKCDPSFSQNFEYHFWRVFVAWPYCAPAWRRRVRCSSLLGTTKNATKSLSLGQCPPLTTTQLRLLCG